MIFYFYKRINSKKSSISQDLFDYMFNDFENNLREMGFGDIAVNKKMKIFIKAFYGRLSQYNKSLDLIVNENDETLLKQTILNNIFKGKSPNHENISMFVKYIINNVNSFLEKTESENLNCNFTFVKFS